MVGKVQVPKSPKGEATREGSRVGGPKGMARPSAARGWQGGWQVPSAEQNPSRVSISATCRFSAESVLDTRAMKSGAVAKW